MDAELLTFFDEKPVDNCVYDLIDILIKNTQDLSLQGSYMELKKTLEGNNTSFAKQKRDQIRKLPEVGQIIWNFYHKQQYWKSGTIMQATSKALQMGSWKLLHQTTPSYSVIEAS